MIDGSHVLDILTDAIEVRLDYMGSTTLMGRMCHIAVRLKDDRHSSKASTPVNEEASTSTLILLNAKWSQLHLILTRSTTPDLIKMSMKLTEFFKNQLASSKDLFQSIHKDIQNKSQQLKSTRTSPADNIERIKRQIGMNGGEIVLQGHNLTLILFHGTNFKARQWAVFSLNEPQINFVTDRGEKGESLFTNCFDIIIIFTSCSS